MEYEQTDITLEVAQNALSYCDYNDRDEWIAMGMALKSEFGAEAFDIWNDWSQNYAKHEASVCNSVWKSFKGGSVTIGTLIDAGLKKGFTFEKRELTPEQRQQLNDERAQKMKARQEQDAIDEQKKTDYRLKLRDALCEAVNTTDAFTYEGKSEYLDKKQVGAYGVLFPNRPVIIVNDSERGEAKVIAGHDAFTEFLAMPKDKKPVHRIVKKGAMIVPLYDEKFQIWNFQVIYNTGTKRFLAGRKQGCFHIIGQMPQVGRFNVAYAEGYANAACIHQTLNCPVVVCFDAGNMLPVTKVINSLWGDNIASHLFCADDDAHLVAKDKNKNPEKNKGYMKAKKAAELVDGIVILPMIDPVAVKDDDSDILYVDAVNFVIEKQKVSASGLQKELKIGYNRASRLIEIMQNNAVVSKQNEKGKREVLIPKNENGAINNEQ